MTDAQGKRDVVVAPTTGGLNSPFLIVKENEVEAAFAYAGDRPLARVDEAGNPLYYLMDAMGSVIGLVDSNGQEVAEFRYDSFGNLQTPEALPSELGGDFRFQGQWLESNTDLYHFRARYYDPETGRFVSRDPVEVIERLPESSNPYQFVYNNPYVYSDPSGQVGVFTGEAFASKIQTILRKIYKDIKTQSLQEGVERAKGVVANLAQDFLADLAPSQFAPIFNLADVGDPKNEIGDIFEGIIIDTALKPLLKQAGLSQWVWREVDISKSDGKPWSNGYRIDRPSSERQRPQRVSPGSLSDPDFVISSNPPRDLIKYSLNKKTWVIGDLKTNANKAVLEVVGRHGEPNQWDAISNFSKNYQYVPVALYIAAFTTDQTKIRKAQEAALESYGVFLRIASLTSVKRK